MKNGNSLSKIALPLLLAMVAHSAAQSFLLLALPSLARDLGLMPLQTGILLGFAALLSVIAAPFWGIATECARRKFVLVTGFSGASVGFVIIAFVIAASFRWQWTGFNLFFTLLPVRIIQSLLTGGILPAAQAWMADHSDVEHRTQAMGLMGAAFGLGDIIGSTTAFIFGENWPIMCFAGLAFMVACFSLLLALTLLPSSTISRQKNTMGWRAFLKVLPTFIITFLSIVVFGFMQHVTSLRLEDSFDISRQNALSLAGGAMLGASIFMIIGQIIGVRFFQGGPQSLIKIGCIFLLCSMISVTYATSSTMLIFALFLMGLGLGLILPANLAYLSLIAGRTAQGKMAGINAVAQGLGVATGAFFGAILYRTSVILPSSGGILISLLILTLVFVQQRVRPL